MKRNHETAAALLELGIEPQTWRVAPGVPEPPQDRAINIIANLVDKDEWSTSVEPYEGFAKWSADAQDFLNEAGLSIRGYYESELVILGWHDERRFVLVRRWSVDGEDAVKRLAPQRPRLALPAPAWMSTPEHPFNQALWKLSDAELENRARQCKQFIDYILFPRYGRAHLWYDHHAGGTEVERQIRNEIANRWLFAREKRRSDARKPKKARAAL